MNQLPPEVKARISKEAEEYSTLTRDNDGSIYHSGARQKGFTAGATAEATRAMGLLRCLENIARHDFTKLYEVTDAAQAAITAYRSASQGGKNE